MAVVVLFRHVRDVINNQLYFTVLLNGDFHHARVLSVALFIFQCQTYSPGIEFFLFGFVRAVLPGGQHQVPVVIVPLCQGILFANRHKQRAGSIVFRLP